MQNIFVRAGNLGVVDVATDADGKFSVQALFGLAAGPLKEQIAVFVANDHVRNDLLKAWIFFDNGAAAEGVVGKNIFERAIEIGAREFAGEQFVNARGGDDQDVFFVHARNLRTRESFVDIFVAMGLSVHYRFKQNC